MLMLKHRFFFALLFILLFNTKTITAQQYKGAVGGRFGYGIGLTGVYMLENGHGFEFLLRYGYHGLILNKPGANIQALYQKHWELGRSGAWTAYVGAGPAIGYGKKSSLSKKQYFALGVSPQVGIDYTTQRLVIPIIFALDYKPTIYGDFPIKRINGNEKAKAEFSYYEIALSVRFGFEKNGKSRYRRR